MLNFLIETFLLGLKNLRLHKLRSLLTALGIIFGVAAVIIMVAMGEGAKREALDQLSQLGARNILVKSIRPPENSDASNQNTRVLDYGLKHADLTRLQTLPGIEKIVPLRDTDQKVCRGNVQISARAIGTTPDAFDVINLKLARGEYFTPVQSANGATVCVLGAKAAEQLFPFGDPLNEQIRVGTTGQGSVLLTVIGVLERTGLRAGSAGASMVGRDLDLDIYFPLKVSEDAFGESYMKQRGFSREYIHLELSEVWLKAKNVEDVEDLADTAEYLVGMRQKNGPQDMTSTARADIKVDAPIEILRTAERQQRTFNFIMVGIAAFALVVGGIGIMNIMLATVTERTREIGIRRALGAKRRHITLQFLIETTVISLCGGFIGILLGCGVAKVLPVLVSLLDSQQKYPTAIAVWSVVGSFVVSGMIGIGFGLYPAIKAAWMNPIEALRHE
jgi:putative ABC transport system permease protein